MQYRLKWEPFVFGPDGERISTVPPDKVSGDTGAFPHIPLFDKVEEALVEGRKMFPHLVRDVPAFRICAGSELLAYENGTDRVVGRAMILRTWAICPGCFEAGPLSSDMFATVETEPATVSDWLYDRQERRVLRVDRAEEVREVCCTSCGGVFDIEAVVLEIDNAMVDTLGIRYISGRLSIDQ